MRRTLLVLAALLLSGIACNIPGTGSDGDIPIDSVTLTPDPGIGGQTPSPPGTTPTIDAETGASPEPSVEPETGVLPAPLYFIADDRQIWRVEIDGTTLTQITSEASPVTNFDVSPIDGSVAYVSNNILFNVDVQGGSRAELVNGGPLPAEDDYAGQVSETIGGVAWAPDGLTIAFGLGGVNFYDIIGGTHTLVIPSDPYPDIESGNFPEGPVKFYNPADWSPSGDRLVVNFSYWPEAGGTAVYEVATGSLTDVTSSDGIVCCDARWSLDGSSLYWANPYSGMIPAGMWRADAPGWVATNLIHGESEGGWMLPQAPQQLSDGLLYYFYGSQDTFPEGNVALQMTRSAPDGVTNRETLRDDAYSVLTGLWAEDASGAVIVDQSTVDTSQFPFTGSLIWLPSDGSPAVTLPKVGGQVRWGQ